MSHGHCSARRQSRTYSTWANMIKRCTVATHRQYPSYGGRGITICDRWRKFDNFLADMGEKPPGLTLERQDNDKGYGPDNCTWATQRAQLRNTRLTSFVTVGGARRPLADVCEELGLNRSTVRKRASRSGITLEEALYAVA